MKSNENEINHNNEYVKRETSDGSYFLIKKDNYHEKIGDVKTDKKYKTHKDNEQYITSIYLAGAGCEGAVQSTPKKTNTSSVDGLIATRLGWNLYHHPETADDIYKKIYNDETITLINDKKIPYKFVISKNTAHLTQKFLNHGSKSKQLIMHGKPVQHLFKVNFARLKDEDFNRLKSFYFKSMSCYGAYYDGSYNNLFEEIQKKLKACQDIENQPKCFVKLAKKNELLVVGKYNTQGKLVGITEVPYVPKDSKEKIYYEDVKQNKDKYFNYYYITDKDIYKVPHSLVKNRVELIDSGKFQEEFEKLNLEPVDKDKEFHEYYERPKKPLGDLGEAPEEELDEDEEKDEENNKSVAVENEKKDETINTALDAKIIKKKNNKKDKTEHGRDVIDKSFSIKSEQGKNNIKNKIEKKNGISSSNVYKKKIARSVDFNKNSCKRRGTNCYCTSCEC